MNTKTIEREIVHTGHGRMRAYCWPWAPWNKLDNLANVWDYEIAVEKVPTPVSTGEIHEIPRFATWHVKHWAFGEEAHAAADPGEWRHEIHAVVYHSDVDPITRVCATCDTRVKDLPKRVVA